MPVEPSAPPAAATRVLLVIPTLNEAAHIDGLLAGLLADPPATASWRIVVVDGGSTDGTIAKVKAVAAQQPAVQLLHNPARIQSAALNLAARQFGREADVLIRCDAHAVYPAGFCQRLLDSLAGSGADAVVVPMDSIGHGCLARAVAWVSNSPVGTGGSAHRGGHRSGFVDHGHHAAFRMDMFRRAGGYDESFTHNEDAELDCRQRALGARIYLDAGIRLGYHPRSSLPALARQYFRYGAGRSRTARRHPGSLRLRQLAVPAHLLLSVTAVAISPWFAGLLAWPAFYVGVLLLTSLLMAVRHRSACGLLAGVAAATMHTAWALGFLSGLVSRREQAWQPVLAAPLWPAESRTTA